MRKMILAAMLVTVAAPAMAQDQDAWAARRAERQQQREQRSEAPGGETRQQRPQEVRQPRVEQQQEQEQRVEPQRAERAQEWRRSEQQARPEQRERLEQRERPEQPRVRWSQPAPQVQVQVQAPVVQTDGVTVIRRGEQGGDRRRWEGQRDAPPSGAWQQQRQQRGEWQQRHQHDGWQQQPQQRDPQAVGQWQQQPRRDGEQRDGQHRAGQSNGQRWAGHNDGQRWSSQWRNDHRYDWQRYRARNQSIFRIGSYYDPFGWSYRRPSIGITLYAGYYQPDYWLDDPWQYRLPPVYGPYRWVRYYDDALLVDIYSGRVVDVIDNFFW
ncbi:RcnB family protein [Sphingomonas sp. RB1R13]|uniref:RcnB family protein n=1 Tax=Sphingomonas sp. RB1R13 TaxID=3096159 RepID=UPI002FCA9A94